MMVPKIFFSTIGNVMELFRGGKLSTHANIAKNIIFLLGIIFWFMNISIWRMFSNGRWKLVKIFFQFFLLQTSFLFFNSVLLFLLRSPYGQAKNKYHSVRVKEILGMEPLSC